MARRVSVAISKGGTGKTTTTVHLAHGLALAGHRVLLVDTDAQGQAGAMLGLRPEAGLAELVSKEASPEEAVLQARERLWLLAGGRSLAGIRRLIDRKETGAERVLSEALTPLEDGYEYIILDTAPGLDPMAVNCLFYAEEVLAPVSLEVLTLRGLLDFSRTIQDIQVYRPEVRLRYVLPTFLDGRVRKSGEILGQLHLHYSLQLCSPIRYSVKLSEAPGFGQTVFEYAPRSSGAADYQLLTERIISDGRP